MIIRLLGLIVSIIILFVFIFQKKVIKWKKLILILLSILLLLFMLLQYLIPVIPSPKPSGENLVYTDTIYYSYKSNIPEMLTSEDEREIPIQVYYPKNLQTKKHPLLIYSPGSFGGGNANETLFLELASNGYIVMGLNHPYHTFDTKMSDGSSIGMDFNFVKDVMDSQGSEDLEGTLISLNNWSQIRIDDIDYVLDKILDSYEDNEFEQYIDKNRVILSGHSLGGAAMLAIGRDRYKDIKALVILESPFIKDIIGIDKEKSKYIFKDEEYPLPLLHIYSDALYSRLDEITTYEMNARLLKSNNTMYVNKHIEGVGHLGLTDLALVTPIITDLIDGGLNKRKAPETLLEINKYVIEFLEKYNK